MRDATRASVPPAEVAERSSLRRSPSRRKGFGRRSTDTLVGLRARARRQYAAVERPIILVAEDDADSRLIYATYLRKQGCEVSVAIDGSIAVEKADLLWPDVIVMDLSMPRVDGWEAIRRLRQSSWTNATPIVAISAVPMSRESALEAGCDAYLEKPCDPHVLWLQIRALLGGPASGSV